jgi:N-terminal acetyltransferase B complex catalytic subunit
MDWSEVLALAAAKGWNEHAISRTAQRCAALFGESMSLIPLEEETATRSAAEPVQYTPSMIPSPYSLLRKDSAPPKRPYFRTGTLRCPHVDCYGHENDFEAPYRVVQHCIRVHQYDPRTNDSDNEDRFVGGVHIDGFLQPIAAQRGWGKPRSSGAKRKQKEMHGKGHDAGDAMIIDSD